MNMLRGLLMATVVVLLGGCASHGPVPVEERGMPAAAAKAGAAAAGPVADRAGFYTVKKGDTLYSIALDHGQDYKDVAAWNYLENPNLIKIGQQLRVVPPEAAAPVAVAKPVSSSGPVEIRNAPWALWIHDLASPDPYYILPLVMTLTTLLQTALNPAPPDPMQAKLMWFMPLIFSVMFFFFPAGLVLYWLTNNVLGIAQQWFINRQLGLNK